MTKGKNQHVVPVKNGWGVRGSGNSRLTAKTDTKVEAEKIAKRIAKNQLSEVVLRDKKSIIRDSESHGNDPNPPKDKKH